MEPANQVEGAGFEVVLDPFKVPEDEEMEDVLGTLADWLALLLG